YGCVLGAQQNQFDESAEQLARSRPTAVNLFWALRRMARVVPRTPEALLREARAIHEEDAAMCQKIGEHALALLERHRRGKQGSAEAVHVLTHCNAGALATGGIGTATAGIYLAHQRGLPIRVLADETRPLLQ